jgi:misacylated tRNA(Ala) deacylase
MTEPLFRKDAYLTCCDATVTGVNDRGGIILDQTIAYPNGGGQPGDRGTITTTTGTVIAFATTVKGEAPDEIVHVPDEGQPSPERGETVTVQIDAERRMQHTRIHTALHLLSVALPYPVTGGQITSEYGRLDFDASEPLPPKDEIANVVNALIDGNHAVTSEWITDAELDANPGLVKTMSVKPPRGSGRVRLIRIGEVDLQPCGGTHVAQTSEIGPIDITEVKSKGAKNRRERLGRRTG